MKESKGQFAVFLKQKRKETNITQQELAQKAGVGLRLIREIEQGKKTIRLDRLNAVLSLFGYCTGPVRLTEEIDHGENG